MTRGSLNTLQSILNYREETNEVMDPERELLGSDFGSYRNLFTGFPDFSISSAEFSINASSRPSSGIASLSVRLNPFGEGVSNNFPGKRTGNRYPA